MYDLITIGNVTTDFFFSGPSLTEEKGRFQLAIGGKYPVDFFYESVGGSGANVAIWCSREGLDTAVVAKIGENTFKQIILQKLIKKNVSTEFLLHEKTFFNITSILLNEKGEKTVVHYTTPQETLDIPELVLKNMDQSRAIFMGNLSTISLDERVRLLTSLKTPERLIFLNPGILDCQKGVAGLKPLLILSDVLFLNTHEFCELVKKDYKSLNFEKNCADLISFEGKALVLTDGENGSYAYSEGKVYKHEAPKVTKVADTTGAGDSFSAGFIAGYLNSDSIEESLERATTCAKKNLEAVGAN